jgi:hypothetical protein
VSSPDSTDLSSDIAVAQQKIALALELTGKEERKALIKLEQLVISIGTKIEAESLKSLGLSDPKELEVKWLAEFEKRVDSFDNVDTWNMKSKLQDIQEFLRYAHIVSEYPGSYYGTHPQFTEQVRLAEQLAKEISTELSQLTKSLAMMNPEMWTIFASLRDAYHTTLQQRRDFGRARLEFEDFDVIITNSGQSNDPKIVAMNLKSITEVSRLLPKDWINASNNHNQLFIIETHAEADDTEKNSRKEGARPGIANSFGAYGREEFAMNKVRFKELSSAKNIDKSSQWIKASVLTLEGYASEPHILHELGHRFSEVYPIIGALEETYYLRRTTQSNGKRAKSLLINGITSGAEGSFIIRKDGIRD